jgi:hypothetical protein
MALDKGVQIMWLIAGLMICLAGLVWWVYFKMKATPPEERFADMDVDPDHEV